MTGGSWLEASINTLWWEHHLQIISLAFASSHLLHNSPPQMPSPGHILQCTVVSLTCHWRFVSSSQTSVSYSDYHQAKRAIYSLNPGYCDPTGADWIGTVARALATPIRSLKSIINYQPSYLNMYNGTMKPYTLCKDFRQCLVHVVLYFFSFYYFYWSIIALQCANFCCSVKWISHIYTYLPSLLDLPPASSISPIWSSQSTSMGFLCYMEYCSAIKKNKFGSFVEVWRI